MQFRGSLRDRVGRHRPLYRRRCKWLAAIVVLAALSVGGQSSPAAPYRYNLYEAQLADAQAARQRADGALIQARSVLARAEQSDASAVIAVAQEAVRVAEQALAIARGAEGTASARSDAMARLLEEARAVGGGGTATEWHRNVASFRQPTELRGQVEVRTDEGWVRYTGESALRPGDTVRTGSDGVIEFLDVDGGYLRLGPNAELTVDEPSDEATRFTVQGAFRALKSCLAQTCRPHWYRPRGCGPVQTSHGSDYQTGCPVAAVRGTELAMDARKDGSFRLVVLRGEVAILVPGAGDGQLIVGPADGSVVSVTGRLDQQLLDRLGPVAVPPTGG